MRCCSSPAPGFDPARALPTSPNRLSCILFAPDLPKAAVQQSDDFLLNLRIVQQTQKRLFESLVLLSPLQLVFSFGSIFHRTIMP